MNSIVSLLRWEFEESICEVLSEGLYPYGITLDMYEEKPFLWWEAYEGLPNLDINMPNRGAFIASGRVVVGQDEIFLESGNDYEEQWPRPPTQHGDDGNENY